MDRLVNEMRQGKRGAAVSNSGRAVPSGSHASHSDEDRDEVIGRYSRSGRSREPSRARSRSLSPTQAEARNGRIERRRSASTRGFSDRVQRPHDESRRGPFRPSSFEPEVTGTQRDLKSPVKLGGSRDQARIPSPIKAGHALASAKDHVKDRYDETSPATTSDEKAGEKPDVRMNKGISSVEYRSPDQRRLSQERLQSQRSPSHVPSTPPTPSTPPLSPAPQDLVIAAREVTVLTKEQLAMHDKVRETMVVKMEEGLESDPPQMSSDNALGLRSPQTRLEEVDNHPPTSPLTEIQPSSPVWTAKNVVMEPEDSSARRDSVTPQDKPVVEACAAATSDSPLKPSIDADSRSDATIKPESLPKSSPTMADVAEIESEVDSEKSLEPYGKEYIEFDLSTYAAAKDLLATRHTNRTDMNSAIDTVLSQNNWARDVSTARGLEAGQIDSWQIARHKANHPSTWVRQIVARRHTRGKEEHKRYVQALQEEWTRLDEAWQKQRVIVEEENEQLRRIYEASLPPPTPAVDKDTRPAPRNRRRGAVDTDQQMLGIHDGDEAGLERILMAIRQAEEADPVARARKTEAVIPDMILEPSGYRLEYDDNTSLIQDPLKFYDMKHETDIEWTAEEDAEFRKLYVQFPKRFGEIADQLPGRTASDCVNHYYLAKKEKAFKEPVRGGTRQYKEVPISSIANSRNTITAPRTRLVGMVRGKALVTEPTDKDAAGPSPAAPTVPNSRKQTKRKLDDADKVCITPASKDDASTGVPAKVRKKPGPKPGTKRKATTAAITANAAASPQGVELSAGTPAKKRKTAKPRSKKAAELTLASGETSLVAAATRPSDQPITPATASTVGSQPLQPDYVSGSRTGFQALGLGVSNPPIRAQAQAQEVPYTATASVLTYPDSMSFRPGASTGGWSGQHFTSQDLDHSKPYLPALRDFMSGSRIDKLSSTARTYAAPPPQYPLGVPEHVLQQSPFHSALPPTPVISIGQNNKESSAPPQVFRRSNINDLLNASNDEAVQAPASRSAPPPEIEPDTPNRGSGNTSPPGYSTPARRSIEMDTSESIYSRRSPIAATPSLTEQYPSPGLNSDRTRQPLRDPPRSDFVTAELQANHARDRDGRYANSRAQVYRQ